MFVERFNQVEIASIQRREIADIIGHRDSPAPTKGLNAVCVVWSKPSFQGVVHRLLGLQGRVDIDGLHPLKIKILLAHDNSFRERLTGFGGYAVQGLVGIEEIQAANTAARSRFDSLGQLRPRPSVPVFYVFQVS